MEGSLVLFLSSLLLTFGIIPAQENLENIEDVHSVNLGTVSNNTGENNDDSHRYISKMDTSETNGTSVIVKKANSGAIKSNITDLNSDPNSAPNSETKLDISKLSNTWTTVPTPMHVGHKSQPQSDQPNDQNSGKKETNEFVYGPATHQNGNREKLLGEGVQLVEDFYERYNATRQVDLVFVLDRSASVPRAGWFSMINFIRDLLEHFTVDAENTRVSIITFSTDVSVEINDLPTHTSSDRENKCTLIQRLENYVKPKVTFGHTATYSALRHAYNVLLNSRPQAKKAVFVLTDGQSNIGKTPVLAAFDIKSLSWDPHWNTTKFGPQVEIYALGIENATLEELQSMASDLPKHVFLIPDFRDFSDLARRLYAHKQEQTWIPAAHAYCSLPCMQMDAHCMCGTRVGEYDCICPGGHQRQNGICQECPKGSYKETKSPERCIQCPVNMTTDTTGAKSKDQCVLHPNFRICPELPDIANGTLFFVRGTRKDEVFNTKVPCHKVSSGNSCHYQCYKGFRLSGVPIMTCNATAKWEGHVPSCEVVQCLPIDHNYGPLKGGSIDYLDNSTFYDSRVQVTCHSGHHATGATLWKCDEHGRWTKPYGFKCLEMWCNAFMTPSNMSIEPKACGVNKQRLGTKCSVVCPHGFVLEGPPVVNCAFSNNTATWLPARPRCKDVTPPSIVCPEDLVFYVDTFGGRFATYNYVDHRPMVTDNSGLPFQLTVAGEPLDLRFQIGHNFLEYTATDAEGNSAFCTQRIEVKGREVRTEYCPDDMMFTISDKSGKHKVSWRTPEFHSSHGERIVTKCASDLNGHELRSGTYNMDCYPDGYPGTEKCTFVVTVKEPECALPDPEPAPRHGALKCGKIESGSASLFPRTCKILCEEGFEVKLKTAEHLQVAQHVHCHWDGAWEVNPHHWPDCGKIRRQNEAKTGGTLVTNFKGDCAENEEFLKVAFKDYLLAKICPREHKCEVRNLAIHCNTRKRRNSRTRRSLDEDLSTGLNISEPILFSDNDTINANATMNLNNTEVNITHAGISVTSMEFSNDTSPLNTTVITINSTDLDANETSHFFDPSDEVEIEFELIARTPNESLTREEQVLLVSQMESGLNSIYDSVDYADDEGNTFEFKGENITISDINVISWPKFSINCSEEETQITEKVTGSNHELKMCYECPAGTWKSSDYECSPCMFGYFQDAPGQSECKKCPEGTNTTHEQAKSVRECKAPCPSGSFSRTGREDCDLCPLDSFQPSAGQTDCIKCPNGTFSAKEGAVNDSECGVRCEPGTFSSTGLQPCEPCAVDTYQTTLGSTECEPCPGNGHTENVGSANSSACLDVNFCVEKDNTTRCGKHGQCTSTDSGYRCLCDPFFTGTNCETNIDDCAQVTCTNGGTCIDGLGLFVCSCPPQYSGERCEYDRNDCEPNPCSHGICEDAFGNYTCHCLPGYTGFNCDVRIDLCSSSPCLNDGTCSLTSYGYRCQCEPQYTGLKCDFYVDRCASSPCQNGGQCQPTGLEFCRCPAQYTGKFCESKVDHCLNNPCQNNGTCWNTPEGAVCKCPIPFAGSYCHLDKEQDFDLVFESGVTSDYIKLTDALPFNLHQLSLCVWLRTNDAHNFGTLVSYSWQNNRIDDDDLNVFTLYDYGRLQVYINGVVRYTGLSLNTGRWQHLCVTWEGTTGDLNVYVNGTLQAIGVDVASGTFIQAGGIFVIGQKQDSIGNSFISRNSFIGELTQMHMFSKVLSQVDVEKEFKKNRDNLTCSATSGGDVLSWSEVKAGIHGHVKIRNSSLCMDVNECLENPVCPSGHICHDVWGSHECFQADEVCASRPCQNGAKCESLHVPGDFICHCSYGYVGKLCETEVNFCDSNPCHNGATCKSKRGVYKCYCPYGFTGRQCETELDGCQILCENGGTCNKSGNASECVCPEMFTGERCQFPVDACGDLICANGGSCQNNSSDGRLRCACARGWIGDSCQVRYVPSCDGAPCLNNGTCMYDVKDRTKYRCECPMQQNVTWSYGPNCEQLMPCESAPCKHQSTCVNVGSSDYNCLCPEEYTGLQCETYIPDLWTTTTAVDYCMGNPCQNFGTCVNMADHFVCKCTLKYSGPHCVEIRKKELRVYKCTVTLSDPIYTPDLLYREDFHKLFRAQVLHVFWNLTTDSIMRVTIENIRQGSVVVDFRLDHDFYVDSPVAALEEDEMKAPLLNEIKKGKLGVFKATLANFKFIRYYDEGTSSAMIGLYAAIALLTIILVVVVLVILMMFKRRRYFAPRKLNNKSDELPLTRINNPTFDPSHATNNTPILNHRSCAEDNIYAEPGDMLPYYATSDCTDDSSSLGSRFPSKRGRDVNIDWAHKRGKEPDEYLEPMKDKNCFDASRDNQEKEYLEPISDRDYLEPLKVVKDKEYVDTVKDNKDNINKESLEPQKPNGTIYAIKRPDNQKPSDSEQYYFTPLPDEPQEKSNNFESAATASTCAHSDYKVPTNNNPINGEDYMEPVILPGATGYVNGHQDYLDMSSKSAPKKNDHYRTRALPPIPK